MTVLLYTLISLSACGDSDPWTPAGLNDPEVVTSREWYAIELAGRRIGVEERIEGRNGATATQLRRRHYAFEVDGVPTELRVGDRRGIDPLSLDGLDFLPLQGPEDGWPLVDIVQILRRPSAPIDNARRARRGVYRLGEQEVVVERPPSMAHG